MALDKNDSTATRNRIFLWSSVIAVIAAIVVLILTVRPGDQVAAHVPESVFKIGVLAPISGFMSGHGESIQMGAKLASEKIAEQGGVLGHKVELVVLDTKSDPAITAERTRELVGRHKVDLIIGTGTSAETLAAIPEAERSGTPFLYSLDGEAKTCRIKEKNAVAHWVWGTGFTERMVVKPLFQTLARQLAPDGRALKVYFIGGDYVYPRTTNAYAKEVAMSLGYTVLGEEYSDTATQDYAPVVRRIQAAKPDLLIVTNPGASGVAFMRQAKQMQLDRQVAISGFATFDQEAIDAMGDASEGVYCINRYSRTLKNPLNDSFVSAFKTNYPSKTTLPGPTAAAGAYGAIFVAKAAYEKAGSIDKSAFAMAMDDLEVNLPQGMIHVSKNNHIFETPIYVMQIRGGEYKIVETIERATHPDLEACSVN